MPSVRTSRWVALLAAFALLAQGLWPPAAMARAGDGFAVQMCTPQGLQAHDDGGPTGGAVEQNCCGLCVFAAAATPPTVTGLSAPVLYAAPKEPIAAGPDAPAPRARGPPRPPSQGPPHSA